MKSLNICFIALSKVANSKSFIRNLANGLKGAILNCYGGYLLDPVEAEFIDGPEYYWYSSTRDYRTKQKGIFEIELLN